MRFVLALFWSVVWLFQGLDRFFYQAQIGPFYWNGSNQFEKMHIAFSNMNLDQTLVTPLLFFVGFWFIFLSVPFLIVTFHTLFGARDDAPATQGEFFAMGTVLGVLTQGVAAGVAVLSDHDIGLVLALVCMASLVVSLVFFKLSLLELQGDGAPTRASHLESGHFASTGFSRVKVDQVNIERAFSKRARSSFGGRASKIIRSREMASR